MLPVLHTSANGHQHLQHSHWLSPAARTRGRGTLLIHVFGIASLCLLATSTTVMYFRHQRMGYSPLVEFFPGQTSAVAALRLPTGTVRRPPLASSSPAHHTDNLTAPGKGPSGSGLVLSATSSQLEAERHKHLDLIQQQSQQQQQQQQQPQTGQLDAGQALLLPGFWGPGRIDDAATAVQAAVNPQLVQQAQQLLQILQTPPHLRPQAAAAQQLSAWMNRQARQPAATGSVQAQQQAPPAPPPAAAGAATTPAAPAAAAGAAERKAAGIPKPAVSNQTSSSAGSPPASRQQAPQKAATSAHTAALGNSSSSPTVAQHAVVAATPAGNRSSRSNSSSSKTNSTSSGAPVTKQHPPVAHRFWAHPLLGWPPGTPGR